MHMFQNIPHLLTQQQKFVHFWRGEGVVCMSLSRTGPTNLHIIHIIRTKNKSMILKDQNLYLPLLVDRDFNVSLSPLYLCLVEDLYHHSPDNIFSMSDKIKTNIQIKLPAQVKL